MKKYFGGWYYKCQTATQTLAVISAFHGDTRSIMVITDDGAWNFTQDLDKSRFSTEGFVIDVEENGICIKGEVTFSDLTPIRYDIMGPLKYVPLMQCRHSVASMQHRVNGSVSVNGIEYRFEDAKGYIEGDRGTSFPSEYAWTQTFFDSGSLMFSIADIPFAGFHFTGTIAVVYWRGRELRFATYLGARVVRVGNNEMELRQGKYTLSAKLLRRNALPLAAPVNGSMVRTIHESASCLASYRLTERGKTVLEFETDLASFEYEYPCIATE